MDEKLPVSKLATFNYIISKGIFKSFKRYDNKISMIEGRMFYDESSSLEANEDNNTITSLYP